MKSLKSEFSVVREDFNDLKYSLHILFKRMIEHIALSITPPYLLYRYLLYKADKCIMSKLQIECIKDLIQDVINDYGFKEQYKNDIINNLVSNLELTRNNAWCEKCERINSRKCNPKFCHSNIKEGKPILFLGKIN